MLLFIKISLFIFATQNVDMIEIKEATIQHLESLAPLFDDYRVFYEQQSDISGAKQFLKDSLVLT